ncbi:uncharacterized protein J3D65DRAFT_631188 [Phyllosticta citribraziliensis]|uniref:Uncharacterized protein n=1 Tax=Phyllosticta citribraziliensis TaxID=989973 RepID=A0ABR1LES8_9PEZI
MQRSRTPRGATRTLALLLLIIAIFACVASAAPEPKANPEAVADPEAHPEARPAALPEAEPEARPEAEPEAKPEAKAEPEAAPAPVPEAKAEAGAEADPEADPQSATVNNNGNTYAPFSGAIYIVGDGGTQITSASQAQCPANAGQSCSSIGYPNYCCPSSHTCQFIQQSGVCGCCPSGSTCSGHVDQSQIKTVTVTVYQTQTQYVGNQPNTVCCGGAVGGGTYYTTTQPNAYVGAGGGYLGNNGGNQYNGYCSTMYAEGPGLPTTREGACGTILIVNDAPRIGGGGDRGWYGWGVPVLAAVNLAFGGLGVGRARRWFA